MALSMDEQRMLAEIERRLAAEEPRLAARLSSFRRPGPGAVLRSPRARIVGSVFTVALVAIVSLVIYAMIPLRAANSTRAEFTSRPQASPAKAVIVPSTSITSGMHTTVAKSPTTRTTDKTQSTGG
jgi:hypothetical protein